MEFLKKCQEWMAVNVTKVINTGGEEDEEASDVESTKRLLRGESRDTLLSSENTDEDTDCLLFRSRENIELIEEDVIQGLEDRMADIGKEALLNPGLILWHPPSVDFKVTIPIKHKELPFKFTVKKSMDSQEFYFLVTEVDKRSAAWNKLRSGDWLQSFKGDNSNTTALINDAAKQKINTILRTTKQVTIIFQRPKALYKSTKDPFEDSQNSQKGMDILRQSSIPLESEFSAGAAEMARCTDVNPVDIDISLESRMDKLSVINYLSSSFSESESSQNTSTQVHGNQKTTKIRRNSKIHPVESSLPNDRESRRDRNVPTETVCRGPAWTAPPPGRVPFEIPLNTEKSTQHSFMRHRRVVSDSSIPLFQSRDGIQKPTRSVSVSRLGAPTSWRAGEQVDSISAHVEQLASASLSRLDHFSLEKLPIITLPVVVPEGADKGCIKERFCDMLGLNHDRLTDSPFGLFVFPEEEPPIPFAQTIRKWTISEKASQIIQDITDVHHLILAKHCASQLRESLRVLDNLQLISQSLLDSDDVVEGISIRLVGYFLANPPQPRSNFLKLQLKIIKEDALNVCQVIFTKHSLTCMILDVARISSNPERELENLCNCFNLVHSFSRDKRTVVLLASHNDKMTSAIDKVNTHFKNHLPANPQVRLIYDKASSVPLFFGNFIHSKHGKGSGKDWSIIRDLLTDLCREQCFAGNDQRYPMCAVKLGMQLEALVDYPKIITASKTQVIGLLHDSARPRAVPSVLEALHSSGTIVYPDHMCTPVLNPLLDLFVLLKPCVLLENMLEIARNSTETDSNPVKLINEGQLVRSLSTRCIDTQERLAFLELLRIIYPVSQSTNPSYIFTSSTGLTLLGEDDDFQSDKTLMVDFHSMLPFTSCLQILCNLKDNFSGKTMITSPLSATYTGSYEFKLEFSPWNAVGAIFVRLGGKRPWQFIEFLYNLLLSTSRKHKLMNIDYHIGPACPLMVSNKCAVTAENSDVIHVIPIHDDPRTIKCGKNDLRNVPSVKEWLREIVYVHPYQGNMENEKNSNLLTIEMGMSLLQLPATLYSLICEELLVRDRWKSLAGSMGKSHHDVELLTIHENPASTLFHQWTYSEEHLHGPCCLNRLFHYFITCTTDQFYDIKRRVKDWIEDNGYILISSAGNDSAELLPNVL